MIEAEVYRSRKDAEQKKIERLKNEFVSMVSHELRTPLTSIRGALGLMLGKASQYLPEKYFSMLELADRNADRLSFLINDILDLEKIETGNMSFDFKVSDLIELCRRSVFENAAYADRFGVLLKFETDDVQALVHCDDNRLLQVLANLISNAIKFSEMGAEVKVRVEEKDGVHVLSVSDRGAGIPEEFQPYVFQRFAQADSSSARYKNGTGLGLYLSKSIVAQHAGSIRFESARGEGTTFFVELPALVKTPTLARQVKLENVVLICEDDLDLVMTLSTIVEGQGFSVDVASSLEMAKNKLAEFDYSLVLLDLTLPDGPGLDLLPVIGDCPVVVFSGYEEIPVDNRNVKAVLTKSTTSGDDLMSTIRRCLDNTTREVQAR